jgi:hypothetical protein
LCALVTSCAEKTLTPDLNDHNASGDTLSPVIISFSPDSAAYGGEVIIDGEHFGNDTSGVKSH